MMLRIAVVTQYFPTSAQVWAGHSAYQTVRELAKRCDLHVFYPLVTYPPGLRPGAQPAMPIDMQWSPPDVQVTYVPYLALPVLTRPINAFSMARRLLPHVRAYRPDVLLNYVVYPDGYATVQIGRRLHVPVVLTAIGSDLNRISDPMCAALTRRALRQATCVSTVSADLARTACDLGADRSRTEAILNGCDTSIFYPRDRVHARTMLGLDPKAALVVYVGRLDARKGLVELIQAIAILRQKRSNLHCCLVGDGPDRPLLVRTIGEWNAESAVTLVSSRPTEQIAQWMAASDLVTLPSYKEGCPNVVIEALASGRPVVATNVGGIPELMDKTAGDLIPPRDVPALTGALDQVLARDWDCDSISFRLSRSWTEVATEKQRLLEAAVSLYSR